MFGLVTRTFPVTGAGGGLMEGGVRIFCFSSLRKSVLDSAGDFLFSDSLESFAFWDSAGGFIFMGSANGFSFFGSGSCTFLGSIDGCDLLDTAFLDSGGSSFLGSGGSAFLSSARDFTFSVSAGVSDLS